MVARVHGAVGEAVSAWAAQLGISSPMDACEAKGGKPGILIPGLIRRPWAEDGLRDLACGRVMLATGAEAGGARAQGWS